MGSMGALPEIFVMPWYTSIPANVVVVIIIPYSHKGIQTGV